MTLPDFGPGSYALGKAWAEAVVQQLKATQESLAEDLEDFKETEDNG